jgi:3-hydroxyacyl-CoA dehydrogenase
VVTGANGFFCGGAEITEFAKIFMMGRDAFKDSSPVEPLLEMMDMMDNSPKTTVAAINGQALGGGLETALACHYRVAGAKVSVGFPEVNLGILPGGQGTQRLPRLAPLQVCIQMILLGKPMPSPAAQKNGIIDAIAKTDVVEEAAAFALSHKPRPVSQIPVSNTSKVMKVGGAGEQARIMADANAPGMVAPLAIIRCLETACTHGVSFQEGVKTEAKEFTELVFGLQSKALQHLFFSERRIAKVPGLNEKPAPLKKIGILGAGLMGGGIAMCLAQKGVPVILKDAKQDWLDNGIKHISGLWEGQAKRGRITAEKYKTLMGLITPTLKYEDFHDVDMTIEAVPEIMTLKKEVFLELEKHMRPDAFICTNTSGLDIDEIASVLKDPSRVMGCHFFSPANVMQLLENIQIAKSSPKTLATGMAMGKLIGKKTVMVGNCDGFVGNRMIAPYAGEAKMLFEEGATIEQIDKVVLKFGMAMGPNALGDLVGQELFWKQRKAAGDMLKQTKTFYGPYELTDWLCEQGRFGMKTPDPQIKASGRGIFIHRGREKSVDPEVVAKMEEIRKMKGITARAVSDEEIIERLFFPLINEGFKILEEGYVARPSDIDIVYIFGYGFPPAKGGPMFYAEHYVGLPKILERLKAYAADAKKRYTTNKHYLPIDYFEPSKLLEVCAAKQAEGMTVPPGASLIEFVTTEYRQTASSSGPFSKL